MNQMRPRSLAASVPTRCMAPARGRRGRGLAVALAIALLVPAAVPRRAAAAPTSAFAAADNPYRYAGEYSDAAWDGTYLRARWYHPGLSAFVSRDPMGPHLSRYGYGGGNPVAHIDPTGMSYRRGTAGLRHALARLNAGIGGHFARLFLSPALGVMQMAADPRAFWHAVEHDTAGMDIFIATGIVGEGVLAGAERYLATRAVPSLATRLFAVKTLGESALGLAQSAVASTRHGRFHAGTFINGMEYTFGPEIAYRIIGGIGYQPFDLTDQRAEQLLANRLRTTRTVIELRVRRNNWVDWQTPWRDALTNNGYHELTIQFTQDDRLVTEGGARGVTTHYASHTPLSAILQEHGVTGPFRLRAVSVHEGPTLLTAQSSAHPSFEFHDSLGESPPVRDQSRRPSLANYQSGQSHVSFHANILQSNLGVE